MSGDQEHLWSPPWLLGSMIRCCLCRAPEGQPRTFWPSGLEPTTLPGSGYRCTDRDACRERGCER